MEQIWRCVHIVRKRILLDICALVKSLVPGVVQLRPWLVICLPLLSRHFPVHHGTPSAVFYTYRIEIYSRGRQGTSRIQVGSGYQASRHSSASEDHCNIFSDEDEERFPCQQVRVIAETSVAAAAVRCSDACSCASVQSFAHEHPRAIHTQVAGDYESSAQRSPGRYFPDNMDDDGVDGLATEQVC